MKKLLTTAAFAATVAVGVAMASSAGAVTYTTNYSVDAYDGNINNGLVIETDGDKNSPFSIILNGNGATTTFDLFDIWTNEQNVDSDDTVHKDISVSFHFTSPGNQTGSITGDTFAVNGSINSGRVTWDGPLVLNFGAETLTITLGGATFNAQQDTGGRNGCDDCLAEGPWSNADVQATFTQTLNAVGGVPEPASWALMIGGFGMTGAALRRRRTAVAATA